MRIPFSATVPHMIWMVVILLSLHALPLVVLAGQRGSPHNSLLNHGIDLLVRKQYELAIHSLRSYVELYPECAKGRYHLANALQEDAMDGIDCDEVRVSMKLCYSQIPDESAKEIIEQYEQSIWLDTTVSDPHVELSKIFIFREERIHDAMVHISKTIELQDGNIMAHYIHGVALQANEKYNEAIVAYNKAFHRIQTNADFAEHLDDITPLIALARIHVRLENIKAAVYYYETALLHASDTVMTPELHSFIENELGTALIHFAEFDRAESRFRMSLKSQITINGHVGLGDALMQQSFDGGTRAVWARSPAIL